MEGIQLTYSCHTFSHIQHAFVNNVTNFSCQKSKLDLVLICVHERWDQHLLTRISSLKQNYFFMLVILTRFSEDYFCEI